MLRTVSLSIPFPSVEFKSCALDLTNDGELLLDRGGAEHAEVDTFNVSTS
jgi:hypothetical protein